jgi:hypothetical protein
LLIVLQLLSERGARRRSRYLCEGVELGRAFGRFRDAIGTFFLSSGRFQHIPRSVAPNPIKPLGPDGDIEQPAGTKDEAGA